MTPKFIHLSIIQHKMPLKIMFDSVDKLCVNKIAGISIIISTILVHFESHVYKVLNDCMMMFTLI